MELLKVENLSFAYPDREDVLEHISFSMKEGEFLVLCGESGCGKTTLLRLLKRELAPHGKLSGEIFYRGTAQSCLDVRTQACEIGFVMQNPENQIVTDKVWTELAFGLENMGMDRQTIRRRTAETAGFFGLDTLFRKKTDELSGGQKQMLNLASIVAMHPRLLILDEPTSQLDPIAASEFIHMLVKLNREFGIGVLLTEHRLEEVLPVADRAAVMEKGQIVLMDTPAMVCKKLQGLGGASRILEGFPSAVRIYQALGGEGFCPLTVKEGQDFLKKYYRNDKIRSLKRIPEQALAESETVLALKEVWFRYERELPDVLENVSLEVKKGEIVSLLGGNGSGKTTLLGVMAGVLHPYRGKVYVCGKRQKSFRGKELYTRGISMLPQNPQLAFLKESVREDMKETGKVMGYSADEMEEKIVQMAERLGIAHLLDVHPYDLSGGEQQKAAIAKILLLEPKILLLDEPTKGIDAYARKKLEELLKDLKKKGTAIVLVTHDIEFAASCSDRCGMVFDRELISLEGTSEFFGSNYFYTTMANRIGSVLYDDAMTCRDVAALCLENGRIFMDGKDAAYEP